MSKKRRALDSLVVGVRLDADVIKRADALIPKLRKHGDLTVVRISRGLIVRLAVLRGLASLEGRKAGK